MQYFSRRIYVVFLYFVADLQHFLRKQRMYALEVIVNGAEDCEEF